MAPRSVFDGILGQAPAVETLTRALHSGRVHHAYRFEGPSGVGKERAAFALAQSLVCEGPGPLGCGECSACKRAVRLAEDDPHVPQHPDVVLLERGLYPASALGTSTRESTLIGVEQVRKLVLARVGYSPHEGRALVFIVRAAEELSLPAANALLKTLEEPPNRVHFVLLTSQPHRLLDTIRSRTLAVRFGALPEPVVERLLVERSLPAELARHAGGSVGNALALADEEAARARSDFVTGALTALEAPSLEGAVLFASNRPDDRDLLKAHLEGLSQHFALDARDHVETDVRRAERAARRYAAVLEAVAAVERNAQPGLTLESMMVRLRAV
ncbi:MAG TPA: DNA polymerase III subunit delta' [Polyangiaceae bacterium]|nr:DNA polymerase III subunit delta' [Polyangiaceae bacterium]